MSFKHRVLAHSVLVAGLGLALPGFMRGGSALGQTMAGVPAAAEEGGAPLKDDASHQGIKVHGHWKIVVKNQDGSVDHVYEFENSLTPTGSSALGYLLGALNVSGGLFIDLLTSGTSICGKSNCVITNNSASGPAYSACAGAQTSCANGMTQTVLGGGNIVLAGQLTASQAGSITQVATYVQECLSTSTIASCASNANGVPLQFTGTTITAIPVNANQVVQVSVTISFA